MTSVQNACTIVIIVIVVSMPLVATSTTAQATSTSSHSTYTTKSLADSHQNRTLISSSGLNYEIEFNKNGTIVINVQNQKKRQIHTGLAVDINRRELYGSTYNLSPSQTRSWEFNITRNLDITRDNHTVTVSTFGDYTQYNFTRDINSSTTDSIPKPHITNVEVTNGTIDGKPSAVAKVSVSNPSIQAYGTKLMVFTEGTDGSFYDATLPPGENRTITVELLDQRGAKVAGEARLYTKNLSRPEGAMDQVEFVGQAGENTTVWNESYDPVNAPWRSDHYEYQNESIQTGADKTGIVPGMSWTQEFYAGLGVAILGLVGLKRKLT